LTQKRDEPDIDKLHLALISEVEVVLATESIVDN